MGETSLGQGVRETSYSIMSDPDSDVGAPAVPLHVKAERQRGHDQLAVDDVSAGSIARPRA